MVSHESAMELTVRVLEELTPLVQGALQGGSGSRRLQSVSFQNDIILKDTYSLFHLMEACLKSLLRAGRVDAIQDCLHSLAEYTLPVRLSHVYSSKSSSLSIVWLRMGLQELLTQVMQHIGNGYHPNDSNMMM
jgi:hypothetical protein